MKFTRIVLQKSMKSGKGYWQCIYICNPSAPAGSAVHMRCSRVYYDYTNDVEYVEFSRDVSREYANNMFLTDRKNGYNVVKFTVEE